MLCYMCGCYAFLPYATMVYSIGAVVGTNLLIRWSAINEINVSVNKLIRYFHFY